MDKRHFLGAALAAGSLPALAGPPPKAPTGPALLTISGAIRRSNRGALDPVRDQMMFKQKLSFPRAFALDFAMVAALPARTIRPALEYDGKPHALRGPLLADVLALAGAQPLDAAKVVLRAVDGYAAAIPMAQVRTWKMIVATHLDGQPMALGGLGPCGRSTMRTACRRWRRGRSTSGSAPAPGRCTTSRYRPETGRDQA